MAMVRTLGKSTQMDVEPITDSMSVKQKKFAVKKRIELLKHLQAQIKQLDYLSDDEIDKDYSVHLTRSIDDII